MNGHDQNPTSRGRSAAILIVFLLGILASWPMLAGAEDVTTPKPIPDNATPVYPNEAYRAGVEGTVSFRCTIDESGKITDVEILQVPADGMGFEESVRSAVLSWRFEPARRDGAPIASVYRGKAEFFKHHPYEHARMYERSSAEVWEVMTEVLDKLKLSRRSAEIDREGE